MQVLLKKEKRQQIEVLALQNESPNGEEVVLTEIKQKYPGLRNVNVSTIDRYYRLLEKRGFIVPPLKFAKI